MAPATFYESTACVQLAAVAALIHAGQPLASAAQAPPLPPAPRPRFGRRPPADRARGRHTVLNSVPPLRGSCTLRTALWRRHLPVAAARVRPAGRAHSLGNAGRERPTPPPLPPAGRRYCTHATGGHRVPPPTGRDVGQPRRHGRCGRPHPVGCAPCLAGTPLRFPPTTGGHRPPSTGRRQRWSERPSRPQAGATSRPGAAIYDAARGC